jgi:hypothetical protein
MIKLSLLELCPSQADHANAVFANGKDQRIKTASDHADCKPSFLAIVETFICNDKGACPVEILNNIEGDAMLVDIGCRFGVIPLVFNVIFNVILLLQNNFQETLLDYRGRM